MIPYNDVEDYVEAMEQYIIDLRNWFDHLPHNQAVDPSPQGSNPPQKPPPPPGL